MDNFVLYIAGKENYGLRAEQESCKNVKHMIATTKYSKERDAIWRTRALLYPTGECFYFTIVQ